MRLLIVVPRQAAATGNRVTARRLELGLTARGHAVAVVETAGDVAALREATTAAAPQLVLLLHAWRSGAPWLATGSPLPFAVLLTGTDVHIGMHDAQQAPLITAVLARAAAVISQNSLTVAALQRDQPALAGRLHYLPPGITLGATPYPWRERLADAQTLVLLCPAGIRPVKGILELPALLEPLLAAGRPPAPGRVRPGPRCRLRRTRARRPGQPPLDHLSRHHPAGGHACRHARGRHHRQQLGQRRAPQRPGW